MGIDRETADLLQTCMIVSLIIISSMSGILFISALLFHTTYKRIRGADPPRYRSMFYIMRNLQDLYSDILFALYLIFDNHILAAPALFFAFIPHGISVFAGFYFANKWLSDPTSISMAKSENKHKEKENNNQGSLGGAININPNNPHNGRVQRKYLEEFDLLLIGMSIFFGFYGTIEILTSKLFYFKAFNFQLTNETTRKLRDLRFYNIVLCENGIQFLIQIIYIIDTGEVNFFVFFSMLFSVLQLFFGCLRKISDYSKENSRVNVQFVYRKQQLFAMEIITTNLSVINNKHSSIVGYSLGNSYYQFIGNVLQSKLGLSLNIDRENIIVYYIMTLDSLDGILFCFEINNVELRVEKQMDEWNKVLDRVNQLGDETSVISNTFLNHIANTLRMPKRVKLKVGNFEMIDNSQSGTVQAVTVALG